MSNEQDIVWPLRDYGTALECHPVAHGTISHTEKAGAMLRQAAAEIERLQDELAEWRKLRDPATLHVNLLRGVPAQLPRDLYLHLGGVNEIREEMDAARSALQHERDCLEAAKAEIQRLGPDARRYQWLFGARTSAQCADEDAGMKDPLPQDKIISMAASWFLAKASIDAAIDAAMAREESDSAGCSRLGNIAVTPDDCPAIREALDRQIAEFRRSVESDSTPPP